MTLPVKMPMCQRCDDAPAAGPNAKYCAPCRKLSYRSKRRKWEWTRESVQVMRERYDGSVKGRAREISLELGIPEYAVKRMATKLGLTRPLPKSRRPWVAQEDAYLKRSIGRIGVDRMAVNLGRTLASVVLRLKRLRVSRVHDRDGVYTCRDLASLMGVDSHVPLRWIEDGLLPAKQVGGNGQPQKHKWAIEEDDVVRFLLDHSERWWIRGVNQDWFLGLFSKYVDEAPQTVNCDACEMPTSSPQLEHRGDEKYRLCPACVELLGGLPVAGGASEMTEVMT